MSEVTKGTSVLTKIAYGVIVLMIVVGALSTVGGSMDSSATDQSGPAASTQPSPF